MDSSFLTPAELHERENVSEVPELVREYMGLDQKDASGEHFTIRIEEDTNPVSGHGVAYFNALVVERNNEAVYTTGFRKYRGAYAGRDNWDLSFNNPAILRENEDEMVYGLRTGDGNVKVFRFAEGEPKLVHSFDKGAHQRTLERLEILDAVLTDPQAFLEYVKKQMSGRWSAPKNLQRTNVQMLADERITLVLCKHHDRDADAVVDRYRLYVLLKERGVIESSVFRTGSTHPRGRFYTVGLRLQDVSREEDTLRFRVENCLLTMNTGAGLIGGGPNTPSSYKSWEASHQVEIP